MPNFLERLDPYFTSHSSLLLSPPVLDGELRGARRPDGNGNSEEGLEMIGTVPSALRGTESLDLRGELRGARRRPIGNGGAAGSLGKAEAMW